MLKIQIDNLEMEQNIKQVLGSNTESIAKAFHEFVLQQVMQQDISMSIEQLDTGDSMTLQSAIQEIYADSIY